MILIYLIFDFCKSIDISHECSSDEIDESLIEYQDIDYYISCPDSYRHYFIDLKYFKKESTISIFKNSEFTISCSQMSPDEVLPELYIHDRPRITFANCSYFNSTVRIYDDPTLKSVGNITFKDVTIYNRNYRFKFPSHSITYESYSNRYTCGLNLEFKFSKEYIEVSCSLENKKRISYDDFFKYTYIMTPPDYTNRTRFLYFVFDYIYQPDISLVMDYLHESLYLTTFSNTQIVEFFFFDEFNYTNLRNVVLSYLPNVIVRINTYYEFCVNTYDPQFIKDAIKEGWRKICYDTQGYLFYGGNTEGEIIVIKSSSSMLIIGGIVIIVLIIVISFYFIALCRYKKAIKNDSELEFSDEENDET